MPGELFESLGEHGIRCVACAHHCVLRDGATGVCGVRTNRGGGLRVPYGYVARRYVRAVETNTVYHLLPGTQALTFGLYGCDLRCPYCHNHRLSQALRDERDDEAPSAIDADVLAEEAVAAGCRSVCAAYNEPLISAEWVRLVFRAARQKGLRTALISDGHSTPQALEYLRADTDVFRVDLKADSEAAYKQLGGRLQPVLDSIALAKQLGYWVEVVTLVVPGLNQERRALARLGGILRELSPAIPWHLNAFVPRYRLQAREPASAVVLMSAAGAALADGSQFVYVGNVPSLESLSHTRCPDCRTLLIERHDYSTRRSALHDGRCPSCARELPGLWS